MWCTLRPRRSVTCSVSAGGGGEAVDGVLGQLRVERRLPESQALGQLHLPHHVRAARQIERHLDQRLVQGVQTAGEPTHARLVAERLPEGLTQSDGRRPRRCGGCRRARSPFGLHREVEAAVAPELVEHVVVERQAGADGRRAPTVEIDGHLDRRLLRATAAGTRTRPITTAPPQRAEEGVVLGRRADRHPQAAVEAGPARAVPDEDGSVQQPLPDHPAVAARSAGTGRSWRPTATPRRAASPSAAAIRSRSATTCFTLVSISSPKRRARRPATCLAASRWYGSATLSSSATNQRRPDQVAEAGRRHRPRLGEGPGDDQGPLARRPGRARTRRRTDRRPRRPRAGPAPGRRRRARTGPSPRARPDRWGCWASRGRSPTAAACGDHPARLARRRA